MKPIRIEATYGIVISRSLYEEIRIDETWDENGRPLHSDRLDEGFIDSELFVQSYDDPFDKWRRNFEMSVQDGTGSLESFFEKHFASENVRRQGLKYLYPDYAGTSSEISSWKQDPLVSWLYYKKSFEAVFPVICELGHTHLSLELEGKLDDGRDLRLKYSTDNGGALFINGKYLINIVFFDERNTNRYPSEPLALGNPEKKSDGKTAVMLYGVHSFDELMKGLEMIYISSIKINSSR